MSHITTSTVTAVEDAATHVLVFPFPAQGHMLPLLDLTHQLALHGLQITILVTPKNLPILNPLLSTHPSTKTLTLHLPTHPKLPLGVENVKDIGHSGISPIMSSLSKLEGEVIQWFKSHSRPPHVMISDFFLGFTDHWAQQLNIPRIAFFTSGAFVISVLDHLLRNMDKHSNSKAVEFTKMPRSPCFVEHHLPSLFNFLKKGDDLDRKLMKESFLENFRSWGIVFNSFHALEGEYLDHIKKELGHERVYGVGPLSSVGLTEANADLDVRQGVLKWLDNCHEESVLYVCFGSQKLLTRAQMEALALGLERSETQFVWVVKSESSHLVPEGFSTRVANRGLVVHGWAPQVEILNHRAVGSFISHCGWNSVLESIMAGVMLLTWPMEADQFVNARLLVEYMGSAVRLTEGEQTVPDSDELTRVIGDSLSDSAAQKEKAKLIKEKAFEAVQPGGSSSRDLNELVKKLTELGRPTI